MNEDERGKDNQGKSDDLLGNAYLKPQKLCSNCGTIIPAGEDFCPKCTAGYEQKPVEQDSVTSPTMKPQGNWELNERYQSLRFKVIASSTIAGALCGVLTLLVFGPIALGGPRDWGVLHLFIFAFGPFMLAMFVYDSIWIRQLMLPGGLVGVIYSVAKCRGSDLHVYLELCALIVVVAIVISLTEARATTGMMVDFWRSFMFHPSRWGKEFGIRTLFE